MTALLSDHLRATREGLRRKQTCGLFLLPFALGSLIRRINTLIALAEQQEEELRLAKSQSFELDDLAEGGTTILRFPTRIVFVPGSNNESRTP
ncbi:hypothetical protein LH464_17285 [Neorhizobium sp. T786]|uniref:hypothetical protein n=1 Tax=Pseudorhizobium xiangyangii TaxID=2883104 RepID=UPI001CFF932F|nr:hypothetical protein [Neorhizobium xiangyangii]MCB5204222.1 hypothetical protein [Neorhizobium xiangyangii]